MKLMYVISFGSSYLVIRTRFLYLKEKSDFTDLNYLIPRIELYFGVSSQLRSSSLERGVTTQSHSPIKTVSIDYAIVIAYFLSYYLLMHLKFTEKLKTKVFSA